jgi:hypothetical protein
MATRRTLLMAGMVGVGSWVLGYAAELGRGPGKPVHLMVELPALIFFPDCRPPATKGLNQLGIVGQPRKVAGHRDGSG